MNRIMRSFRFILAIMAGIVLAGSVQAQVQLQVSPSSVTLSSQAGNAIPATQVLSVSSSGDAAGTHLTYSALVQNTLPVGTPAWLTVSGLSSGTTPGYLTVSAAAVTPGSSPLPEGVYTGQILIASSGAVNNSVTVAVTFTVARIAASPASLSFSYQIGGSIPQSQTTSVSTLGSPISFTASPSVSSGANWLELAPTTATTPATVIVSLNPAVIGSLAAGTYTGTVSLSGAGDSVSLSVPVTLTVSAQSVVTASPTNLTFLYQTGGTNNLTQQNLSLDSGATPVIFNIITSVDPNPAGVGWLVVSSETSNVTPATLTVGVSPGALPAGTYSGQLSILVNGIQVVAVPISLTVSSAPLISFNPTSLTFTYQVGGANPASQLVTTASTGAVLNYTLFASTSIGGNWLAATGGITTPNPIAVTIDPTGLGPGTYNGLVTVTALSAGNSPQKIPVTLTVTNSPLVVASPNSMIFAYQIGKTAPSAQVVSVTSSTGDKLTFGATSATDDGAKWLSAFFVTGSTPGSLQVGVSTNNLAPGKYTGTVTITATAADGTAAPNSPLAIPITYYVSNNPLIKVSPGSMSFATPGGTQSASQTLALTSTSDALSYSITTKVDTGGPWLVMATQPGLTPASITVYALPINLTPGTYNGSITISATNPSGPAVDDTPVVIPVTLQVVEGTLGATPTALSFTQTLGSAAPAAQNVAVSGTGSQPINFTAVASTSNGVAWLSVAPLSGATPATLAVSADGSQLSPGTYLGTVTISAPTAAGSPQTIGVTLTVKGPTISLTPTSLQFNSVVGGPAPAVQTVAVASSPGPLAFSVTPVTTGNWLSVSPSSGTTPATLSVTVNPALLAVGTYFGTITVAPTAAGIGPQTMNVTLTVGAAVTPLPTSVTNAASQIPGAVAPGEIVSIYGTNMGPAEGVFGAISNNMLETTVAGIQVMFGNTPAPLLYVSATQINAIVPYELSGQIQTNMQVSNLGTVSATLQLSVTATVPGIFTLTENGQGAGAIINVGNVNGGINGAANPIPQGGAIEVFAAGLGQTTPQGVTGNITPLDGTGLKNVTGVTATVAGLPCTVLYAGSAPGFVEGAFQVNVQLPPSVPSGAQALVIKVNGVSSQAGVTVAVQ